MLRSFKSISLLKAKIFFFKTFIDANYQLKNVMGKRQRQNSILPGNKTDPNLEKKNRIRIPDPDTSVLKIFNLYYDFK